MATISAPVAVRSHQSQQPVKPFYQRVIQAIARIVYQIPPLRSTSPTQNSEEHQFHVSIVCISDTHCTQPVLPIGEILLHAGDLSNKGSFDEIQCQLDWLNRQPHPHKIVIAGNHDKLLDEDFTATQFDFLLEDGKARKDLRWGDVVYLQNSTVTISCKNGRNIKIYGSPYIPQCGRWAFQHVPIRDVWRNTVPADVDILLCHGPPAGYLDKAAANTPYGPRRSYGDAFLLREICRVTPRLVVFGHIHGGYGQETVAFDDERLAYEDIMRFQGGIGTLIKLLWLTVARVIGSGSRIETRLINAAVGHEEKNEPVVTTL